MIPSLCPKKKSELLILHAKWWQSFLRKLRASCLPKGEVPYKKWRGCSMENFENTPKRYQNLFFYGHVSNSFPPLRGTSSTTTNFNSSKDNSWTLSSQGLFESIVINFNAGYFIFLSKALSRIIFSFLFRVSNHQIVGKEPCVLTSNFTLTVIMKML